MHSEVIALRFLAAEDYYTGDLRHWCVLSLAGPTFIETGIYQRFDYVKLFNKFGSRCRRKYVIVNGFAARLLRRYRMVTGDRVDDRI
jgi:hypothetical protein